MMRWEAGSAHVRRDEIPVHQVPERLDILGPRVAVVDVIRVFPNIAGQQRLVFTREWGGGVRRARQRQRTVRALYQPAPAGTESADRGLAELFLEPGEVAER